MIDLMFNNSEYIDEPKLMFGDGEALNPQVGLIKYGPRVDPSIDRDRVIKIGIIGSGQTISLLRQFLKDLQYPVFPKIGNKKYLLPYPGLSERSVLNFSIFPLRDWEERITHKEIETIRRFSTRGERTLQLLELIQEKMDIIYEGPSPPDIIIISIPKKLEDFCKDPKRLN